MVENKDLAPEIKSIIRNAEKRKGTEERIQVEPRSLEKSFQKTRSSGKFPIISEFKPTSPSKDSVENKDPVEAAKSMVEAGASAISVLTENEHFGGSPENLRKIREAVDVPVLRKDFIMRKEQLNTVEADIVLLIARFLDNLEELIEEAEERGFQTLVEVHSESELETAVNAGAELIGINNRDLSKLEVDLSTFEKLASKVPENVTLIAESGVKTSKDAQRMIDAGADGILIGSAIMDGEIEENVERFVRADKE